MEDTNKLSRTSDPDDSEFEFLPPLKRTFFDEVFGLCSKKIPDEYIEFFFMYVLGKKGRHKVTRSTTKRMVMTEKDGLDGLKPFE